MEVTRMTWSGRPAIHGWPSFDLRMDVKGYTQQMSHDKNMGWVWMGHSSDGFLAKFQSSWWTNIFNHGFNLNPHFKKIRRYQIDSNRSFAILLVGGFNPSEKYESQWEGWHPIYEMDNNPNVWNHQPDCHFAPIKNRLCRLESSNLSHPACSSPAGCQPAECPPGDGSDTISNICL